MEWAAKVLSRGVNTRKIAIDDSIPNPSALKEFKKLEAFIGLFMFFSTTVSISILSQGIAEKDMSRVVPIT